jgi:integrase
LALRFLALTAVRPGELRGAQWWEFEDLDGVEPLLAYSSARMKGDKSRKAEVGGDHLVPLAEQSVELLLLIHRLSGENELVFPSTRHPRIVANVLDGNFAADAPNCKWAGDISYIWTARAAGDRRSTLALPCCDTQSAQSPHRWLGRQ